MPSKSDKMAMSSPMFPHSFPFFVCPSITPSIPNPKCREENRVLRLVSLPGFSPASSSLFSSSIDGSGAHTHSRHTIEGIKVIQKLRVLNMQREAKSTFVSGLSFALFGSADVHLTTAVGKARAWNATNDLDCLFSSALNFTAPNKLK